MNSTSKEKMPDCMIFLLAKAYQRAHGLFKQYLKPYGLTSLQHLVLEGLWHESGLTAAELGHMLVLDKSTLSGVLDRMETAGWVKRDSDPSDQRVARLYPTVKADALKIKLIRLRQEANETLLKDFSLEEKLLLKRMLADIMTVSS